MKVTADYPLFFVKRRYLAVLQFTDPIVLIVESLQTYMCSILAGYTVQFYVHFGVSSGFLTHGGHRVTVRIKKSKNIVQIGRLV